MVSGPATIQNLIIADGGAMSSGLIAAQAIVIVVAALLARRWLPRGLATGAIIASISCAAALMLATDDSSAFRSRVLGYVLTGLALVWYAVGRIIVYRHQSNTDYELADAALARAELEVVWSWATLVCGLAATALAIASTEEWIGSGWSTGCSDLTPLLLLALAVCVFRKSPAAYYPAAALAVLLLLAIIPAEEFLPDSGTAALVLLIAGGVCLLTVIVVILLDWQRRRRRWMVSPQSLLEEPPSHAVIFSGVIAIGALIGLASLLVLSAGLTPITFWLTSLAVLTVGHVRKQLPVSESGLALTVLGIVSAGQAWLVEGPYGLLLGLGIAGGYCLWLARFWDQQLNDGIAWTTTGRLIPIARRLAMCAAAGAVLVTFLVGFGGDSQSVGTFWAVMILLIFVVLMSMFIRDWLGQHPLSAWSALFAAIASIGPASALANEPPGYLEAPLLAISALGLLMSLRIAIAARPCAYNSVGMTLLTAVLGGGLPVLVSYALVWNGFTIHMTIAVLLAIGIIIVGARILRENTPNIEPKGGG